MDTFDKIRDAQVYRDPCGLTWIETTETDEDSGLTYQIWLLIQSHTDRVLASIDGPTKKQICYHVAMDTKEERKYISADAAKRFAVGAALQMLRQESAARSFDRKCRRMILVEKI